MKKMPVQAKDKTAVKSKMKKAPEVPMSVVKKPKNAMEGNYQMSDTPMSTKERASMKAAKDKKAISALVSKYLY
jgi:hypothetical protein